MANELEGSYAMKSLHKYNLHGKEILLQQATNPKKASSVNNNSHKASIGKGVTNLDDFGEPTDYDTQYLEQELNHLLDNTSPAELQQHPSLSRNSSATSVRSHPQHQSQFSTNGANGLEQLNSLHGFNGNGFMHQSLGINTQQLGVNSQQQLGVNSQQQQQPLIGVNSQQQQQLLGVNSQQQQQLGVNSHQLLGLNSQQLGVNSSQPLGISSSNLNLVNNLNGTSNLGNNWCLPNNTSTVIAPIPLAAQLTSEQLSSSSNFNLLPPSNNRILASLNSNLMNQNSGSPFVSNGHMSIPSTGNPETVILNRFQQYVNQAQSMNGSQRLSSAFKPDTLQQPNSTLSSDMFLEQQVRDRQVQMIQLQANRELEQEKLAKSSMVDSLRNFNSPINTSSITGGLSRGNLPLLSSTANASITNGANESNFCCSMCKQSYDSQTRIPKILSCTHTFCLTCLCALARGGSRVKCPLGCEVVTVLNEGDVTRLTTNQRLLTSTPLDSCDNDSKIFALINTLSVLGKNTHSQSSDAIKPEVCATCSGSSNEQHVLKCRKEGHTLVPTLEAVDIIVRQLQPYITEEVSMLQQTVRQRNSKKERYESVLRAVQKFTSELSVKLTKEAKTQAMYTSMLENLKTVYDNLMCKSYNDLVKIYHVVKECKSNIDASLTNAMTDSIIDEAVKAITVQVHQKALDKVNKLGILQNELFVIDNGGILDNARDCNYANALLQYMVNDLLMSRVDHNKTLHKQTDKCLAAANDDSSSIENLSPSGTSSLSPDNNSEMTNGASSVFRSLTTSTSATPDLTHNERDELDSNADITCLLQTTEAIEAEQSKHKNFGNCVGSASLGLSNICNRVMNDDSSIMQRSDNTLLEIGFMDDTSTLSSSSAPSSTSQILNLNMGCLPNGSSSNSRAASTEEDCSRSSEIKPFSYLDAAKKPAKPDPIPKQEVVKIPVTVKQTKNPHAWLKVTVDGEPIGRIVFQLRPDKAPRMCENFLGLCTGKPGYGYKGTHFFKNGEGFLAGGDVEYDDGRGGYSIFDKDKFEADLCPLKDEVGMIRFKGNGTSDKGKGMVGSQFMVWYAEREFKKFSYSLVFGRVVDGMDVVKKAANVDLGIHDVMIEDCGGGF